MLTLDGVALSELAGAAAWAPTGTAHAHAKVASDAPADEDNDDDAEADAHGEPPAAAAPLRSRLFALAVGAAPLLVVLASAVSGGGGGGAGGGGAAASSVGTPATAYSLANSVTFLGIGDWGRQGQFGQRDTARVLGDVAAIVKPPFVLSLGDNFYTVGVNGTADPQWRTSWIDVYTHPALAHLSWKIIAGNHDYYSPALRSELNWPGDARWVFPSLNYSLPPLAIPPPPPPPPGSRRRRRGRGLGGPPSRACVALVLADTCPFISDYRVAHGFPATDAAMMGNVAAADAPAAQLAWLAAELARARGACDAVVAVGHHPVFSGGDHGDSADLKAAFQPLFVAPRTAVDAYLAGHDHTLIHLEANGVVYVVSGGGSQIRTNTVATPETIWFADAPGFTTHSFNATHAATFFVSGVDGAVLHSVVKPLRGAFAS